MRRSPCPASSLLSDSIEQYRYITSLIVISNIKECIAPANRPRVTPRINDAQSMVETSVFGVNVMDMRVSESAKKNNVAMENASNHPLLPLRLSLRASCSWITHQGLLILDHYTTCSIPGLLIRRLVSPQLRYSRTAAMALMMMASVILLPSLVHKKRC